VRNRFFPLKEAQWKEETAKVKKWLIECDLVDEFEDFPLVNFVKFALHEIPSRFSPYQLIPNALLLRFDRQADGVLCT